METSTIVIYVLGVLAAGGVLFTFLPYLSGDIKAEKRQQAMQAPRAKRGTDRVVDAASRRKQVADSLKEVEQRGKAKLTVEAKLLKAGLDWSKRKYFIACGASGAVLGLLLFVLEGNPFISAAAALVGAFGLPSWILGFLGKRRINKFVNEFPNAVDIIIRGVKAGLPLGDCLRIIASESPEPIRSEFRRIVEAQAMGLSLTEAVDRLSERVPVAEANFFSIVIGIQQKAGGNLTEALTNLSRVIRERKKMKAKVKAVSSEAKSSAAIIGALPFVVGFFVYLTTPNYLEPLFSTTTGHLVLGGCAVWMGMGMMVMKKMISFEI